jgi:hypothetical protein
MIGVKGISPSANREREQAGDVYAQGSIIWA